MNNPEDYASDTDDSDCDFDPKAHLSHGESEEEEDDVLDDRKRNSKTKKSDKNEVVESEKEVEEDNEKDKQKEDDLWASFQDDVKKDEKIDTTKPSTNGSAKSIPKPAVSKPLPQRSSFPSTLKRPAAGGLSNILGQIGKKNKVSVLEQSKSDWNSFKESEGITEELQTHNRGRDG